MNKMKIKKSEKQVNKFTYAFKSGKWLWEVHSVNRGKNKSIPKHYLQIRTQFHTKRICNCLSGNILEVQCWLKTHLYQLYTSVATRNINWPHIWRSVKHHIDFGYLYKLHTRKTSNTPSRIKFPVDIMYIKALYFCIYYIRPYFSFLLLFPAHNI